MTRLGDHAAAKQHIAGPEKIERMAAGIEDVRVDPSSLKPQPGIILTGDAGGDPFLASAHISAMSLDVDVGQALCAGTSGDGDHRGNERGADHAAEPSPTSSFSCLISAQSGCLHWLTHWSNSAKDQDQGIARLVQRF